MSYVESPHTANIKFKMPSANNKLFAAAVGVLLLAVCALAQKAGPYTPEAQKDVITKLPGAEGSAYGYGFSGYLSINGTAPGSKHLHYWLVESLSDPLNAPIAFWTNVRRIFLFTPPPPLPLPSLLPSFPLSLSLFIFLFFTPQSAPSH